jgi:hypothetical protein
MRGIRSSGQFTTTNRFAQGWQTPRGILGDVMLERNVEIARRAQAAINRRDVEALGR